MKNIRCVTLLLVAVLFSAKGLADSEVYSQRGYSYYREYYILTKYQHLIKKQKDGFIINGEKGAVRILDGSYQIERFYPQLGYFVFVTYFEESSSYEVVDSKDGMVLPLYDNEYEPLISPDGKYLVNKRIYRTKDLEIEKFLEEKQSPLYWIDSKTLLLYEGSKDFTLRYDQNKKEWLLTETIEKFPYRKEDDFEKEIKQSYLKLDEIFSDKNLALKAVKEYGDAIHFIPKKFHDDDLVRIAVLSNGSNLEYASPKLKNDKELVLAAIKNHNSNEGANSISEKMRDDYDVVRALVDDNVFEYESISNRMKCKTDIISIVLKKCRDGIMYDGASLWCERIFVETAAIDDFGNAFLDALEKCPDCLDEISDGTLGSIFISLPPKLLKDKKFLSKVHKIKRLEDYLILP